MKNVLLSLSLVCFSLLAPFAPFAMGEVLDQQSCEALDFSGKVFKVSVIDYDGSLDPEKNYHFSIGSRLADEDELVEDMKSQVNLFEHSLRAFPVANKRLSDASSDFSVGYIVLTWHKDHCLLLMTEGEGDLDDWEGAYIINYESEGYGFSTTEVLGQEAEAWWTIIEPEVKTPVNKQEL